MTEGQSSISNILFQNRQTYLRYNQFKIQRIKEILSHIDRRIFTLIPRLLHVNQPGLPGYVEGDVPSGISNFTIDHELMFAAEELFPKKILRRDSNLEPFIETVLLMGSIGSIAHTQKSDLDYTLLIRKSTITQERMDLFLKKLRLIEDWVWKDFKLEVHFFVNDIDEVKNNIFGESDSESTGSALAKLLKEEMYRTLVIVAGRIPFWWVVPVKTSDKEYENYWRLLNRRETLLNPNEFVDMGNVEDISEGEFFGGSIWALIKSFKSPFKTLMKMGLLEEYMFRETESNLLCHEIKKQVFANKPYDEIDPYLEMFDRVQKYFLDEKSDNEVDALRTAFYIKVGTQITADDLEKRHRDIKKLVLVNLIRQWDWTAFKLEQLNQYIDWQMMQKVSLGNRINKILMESYKHISEKNKSLGEGETLISERDTHLLGRKLFSFYRKANFKVESLFALIDGQSGEKELTFLLDQKDAREKGEWYLIRGKTRAFLEQIPPENIIKKASTLQFLIAFTCFNNMYNSNTVLLLRCDQPHSIKDVDLRMFLNSLSSYLAQVDVSNLPNEQLLRDVEIHQLFLFIDFGNPIPAEVSKGDIKDCKNHQEYVDFINRRLERIRGVTAIYVTSWGELFCKSYSGLSCFGRALVELGPQVPPEQTDKKDFLKVFIPGNRRETLSLPWLSSYIVKALKVRGREGKSPEKPVASESPAG